MSLVNMNTEVVIQVNKRKKVTKEAVVIEAFKEKYIKATLDGEGNHVFELKWNGSMYESSFLGMLMTCQYDVERDFSAVKITQGVGKTAVRVRRSKSGRPSS